MGIIRVARPLAILIMNVCEQISMSAKEIACGLRCNPKNFTKSVAMLCLVDLCSEADLESVVDVEGSTYMSQLD